MIIKSITHNSSSASIRNLIGYVFSDNNLENDKGESVTIASLLTGNNKQEWAKQFDRIESRRVSFYGGKEVKYYHTILSFAKESKPTKEELEDLIYKYLELRLDSPTPAFASVHFSESHYHAHIVYAGIDYYGRSVRKSKQAYKALQIKLNDYQMKHHPRLKGSYIDYDSSSKNRLKLDSHASRKREERTGEISNKKKVHKKVRAAFLRSNSIEAFIANINIEELECYSRRGTLTGIIYQGHKYTIRRTLGIDFRELLRKDRYADRLARLKEFEQENQNDKER